METLSRKLHPEISKTFGYHWCVRNSLTLLTYLDSITETKDEYIHLRSVANQSIPAAPTPERVLHTSSHPSAHTPRIPLPLLDGVDDGIH